MSALDELLSQWRSNPDADATIALCSYLGNSSREELIEEVAASAATWHTDDAEVMLAVGRMHLDAGQLSEAQAAFVAAGKANGRDATAFRYLGEVLLRRGDAVRSEKVLARALQLEPNDAEARVWHDRAVLFSALQKRVGVEAVAAEVQRTAPKQNSIPAPTLQAQSQQPFGNVTRPAPAGPSPSSKLGIPAASALPRFESEDPMHVSEADLMTSIARSPRLVTPSAKAGRTTTLGVGLPGPKLPEVKAPPAAPRRPPLAKLPAPPQLTWSEPPAEITNITPPPFVAPSWPEASARSAGETARAEPALLPPSSRRPAPPLAARPTATAPPLAARPPTTAPPLAARPIVTAQTPPPRANSMTAPTEASPFPAQRLPAAAAAAFAPVFAAPGFAPSPAPSAGFYPDMGLPEPELVLEHLSRVGVYEPGGGAAPAWETPTRQKARGAWVLAVAIGLVAAAGAGSYAYSKQLRRERMQQAVALNQEVKKLLESGSLADLRQTDQKLNLAFELDSLSQPAARLWLQNRVLYQLLTDAEVRGIDSAVQRGKTVNLPEKDSAFGRVASFMAEGDLAGGAAALTRWDTESARDPYYQLAAGAVLERAGDLRAVQRYEAAQKLDPEFVPAQLLLARLLLLEFGVGRAKPVLSALREKLADAPITRALSALAWVVDPERPESLPEEAQLQPGDGAKLPAPLSGVPAMVEAVQAMRAADLPKASHAIDSAVSSAMTPSLATGLGFLAIEAGDETLARKAALRALQFSAVYPRARALAARVALLGGRLDEAQKAIEELEPSAPEVAVVRAVVAYEALEPADLEAALAAMGEAAHTRQAYAALAAGPGRLTGRPFSEPKKLEAMATPATAWGELIAADLALDSGNLALAEKILGRRQGDALRPVHFLRLARLYRYQNKIDAALQAAARAREGSMTPSVLIESLYALAKKDPAGARNLLAKHPTVLGPLTGWLAVLADVANKQPAQAVARATKLDLPPAETPLTLRILVARALAAAGDKRARPYVLVLAKQVPKHPDVIEAALELSH